MDLLCPGREAREFPGDAIVEAGADAYDQVGLVHCQIRFERAVHAEHADELGVGAWESTEAHQRQRAGRAGETHQFGEGPAGGGTGIDQPASAVEYGASRVCDQRGGLAQQ